MIRGIVVGIFAAGLIGLPIVPLAADDCFVSSIDLEVVRKLVKAATPAELEKVRAEMPVRNNVTFGVFALRRYELEKSRTAARMLVESIPRSDVELALLYRLTYPDLVISERPNLFVEYFQAIYEVVRKSRRDYSSILRLAVFAQGGDLGETITSYIERLYDGDPSGVNRALLCMPRVEQALICGEESIPCPPTKSRTSR